MACAQAKPVPFRFFMNVIASPHLQTVERSAEGGIVVEHRVTTARHTLSPPIAALLAVLQEPESVDAVAENIGRELTEQMLDLGLLVNADAPNESLTRLLRPFEPRFLHCPAGDPGSAHVCVVGMPTDLLSDTGRGAATGPAALRMASYPPRYNTDPFSGYPIGLFDYGAGQHTLGGVSFVDCGDIPFLPGTNVYEAGSLLTTTLRACIRKKAVPLVLGGDHSLTYWAVQAFAPTPIAVLHLDAHSDLGQCISGQPTNGSVVRALLDDTHVAALVTVGLRGFLPWKETPVRAGHQLFSRADYLRVGCDGVLAALPEDLPLYISLDVDALDPSIAPASSSPVPGGFGYEEMRALLEAVGRKRTIVGMDLVEVNGDRDPQLLSARTMVHLALTLLGSACRAADENEVVSA